MLTSLSLPAMMPFPVIFSVTYVDEMLLRLYYLYEKSTKKCRDLSDFVGDLKEVYKLPEGGNLPVRASEKLFSEWLINMGLTLITWQHSLRKGQSRAQIDNV